MKNHFYTFAQFVKKNFLKKNSLIIELGSNDGTFLSNFNKKNSIGFEPSKSVHDVAKKRGIQSLNKFIRNLQENHSTSLQKLQTEAT